MKIKAPNHSVKYPYKVSILIPSYNSQKYIAEAIESALSQTWKDFELIIADDGSTDRTSEIITHYQKKDKRIYFYKNKQNLGCSQNINFLILNSRGEYIKILIHDDVLHKDYIKNCVEVLEKNSNIGLVTSFQKMIGNDHSVRTKEAFPDIGLIEGGRAQKLLLKNGNWVGGETAVMMRRSALCVGLWNTSWDWTVDRDVWMRILSNMDLFVLPEILSYPRVHQEQATVYLDKNFRFITEELMQLKIAFMFPQIYGTYTKNEKKKMYSERFISLINQGFQSGKFKNIIQSIEIGLEYSVPIFAYILLKMTAYHLMNHLHIPKNE